MTKTYTWADVYEANNLMDPWAYAAQGRTKMLEIWKAEGTPFLQATTELNRRSGRTTYLVAQAVAAHLNGEIVALRGYCPATTKYMNQVFEQLLKPFSAPESCRTSVFEDHTVTEFGYTK